MTSLNLKLVLLNFKQLAKIILTLDNHARYFIVSKEKKNFCPISLLNKIMSLMTS